MLAHTIDQDGPLTFLQPSSGKFFVALDNRSGRWQLFDGPASARQKAEIAARLKEPPAPEPGADDEFMEVVIFITDRCNLGCVYCKYADLTQVSEVRGTDVEKICQTLTELIRDKRQVRITFQGGEPLLMHHQIDRICAFLTDSFPEIDFSFALQSNGTLLNEQILATLQRYDVTVGITIDGQASHHDQTRPFKNGEGSFAAITTNLERLRRGGVRCGVLSVIREPDELMELFRFNREELGLNSFYLKPLEFADSGPEKSEEFAAYYSKLADRQLELMRELIRIHTAEGVRIHEQMLKTVLGKMFRPSIYNDGCIKTPSCGSNERYKSINCDGSTQWCAHLKDQQDEAVKQLSKERYGFCDGCPVSSVCLSFCPAVIPGYRHGDPEACYLPLARRFCSYRRQMMMGLFGLMHENMQDVTACFMNELNRHEPFFGLRVATMNGSLERMMTALRATGLEVCARTRQAYELPFFTTMLFAGGSPDGDAPPLTSGQGVSRQAALLSAYGELFERLQNNFLISDHRHACASEGEYERLPERCRKRLDERGVPLKFFLAPDEEWIAAERFISAESSGSAGLMPREQIPASGTTDGNTLLCAPFYSAFDGAVRLCPVERMLFASGSTGCAAGNTIEQAIAKALFELCERHVFQRIFSDEPPLPPIPRELLQNTEAGRIIEAIEERGTSVTLLDGSLGKGFPVVAVLLIDRQRQRYNCNLGAAPTLSSAVIGALKELYDGGDNFHALPLSGLGDPFAAATADESHRLRFANYYSAKASSTGLWPKSLFASHESAPQVIDEVWSNALAARPLATLLERFASWTPALYIRDVSWLGIPSVYCYAPGLSEVNYATGRDELAMLFELRAESARLQAPGGVAPESLRQIMELHRSLSWIALPAPVRLLNGFACQNLPGSARRREATLLTALAQLFGEETPRDGSMLGRRVSDGNRLADEGCTASEIDSQLRRIYQNSVIDLAIKCQQAPAEVIEEALQKIELPGDERICDDCHFLQTVETARRLQKRQIANLPDQHHLATLFAIDNRNEP